MIDEKDASLREAVAKSRLILRIFYMRQCKTDISASDLLMSGLTCPEAGSRSRGISLLSGHRLAHPLHAL